LRLGFHPCSHGRAARPGSTTNTNTARESRVLKPRPTVIVLAAGRGSRFNGKHHKLEQALGNASVISLTLRHAIATQLPVVVVLTERLVPLVRHLVATRDMVLLPEVGTRGGLGMGFSIAAGIGTRPDAPGWVILPGDMPLVQPATIGAVARALDHHPVTYAQHRGRRGHPVGFGAELFSELATLTGDEGARRLVARYPAHGVDVDDPGALIDVDTEADLAALRADHGERLSLP
jgi:molybdenum cofactor cytidylyltransferase